MALSCVSLNVNGMRDSCKRNILYQWLRDFFFDICLLQETHCSSQEDVNAWSKEWKGKAFWSPGTIMSRGVAILIKSNLDLNIVKSDRDPNSRYSNIDIKINNSLYSIVNIYAPNNPKSRKTFLNNLNTKLKQKKQDCPDLNVIIGGDFNCTLKPTVDRRNEKGLSPKCEDIGSKELYSIINDNEFEDVWRRRNPNTVKYTYHRKNSKIASRIDMWIASKTLQANINKVGITNPPISDHSAITINLNTSQCERGKGFWKMNINILNSKEFDTVFRTFWKTWEKKQTHMKARKNGGILLKLK